MLKRKINPCNEGNFMTSAANDYQGKKPWLNNDGSQKSDEEIKAVMHSWSMEIWDRYLKNYEHEAEEVLLENGADIEAYSYEDDCWSLGEAKERDDDFADQAKDLVAALPRLEARVIRLTFWQGLSTEEIAKRLHRSTSDVAQTLERAKRRLRSWLKKSAEIANAPATQQVLTPEIARSSYETSTRDFTTAIKRESLDVPLYL